MKKKLIWITVAAALVTTPLYLVYATITESTDCSQLVIDTYELHSGIDIPNVDYINCHYDEATNTRISVYQLNESIDLSSFTVKSSKTTLNGYDQLLETEKPQKNSYIAQGEKWGTQWTYAVDPATNTLWAELKY